MSTGRLPEDQGTHEEDEAPDPNNRRRQPDEPKHAGTRDVTEGPAGGTETGGSRNYPSTGGATGVDIGHHPE